MIYHCFRILHFHIPPYLLFSKSGVIPPSITDHLLDSERSEHASGCKIFFYFSGNFFFARRLDSNIKHVCPFLDRNYDRDANFQTLFLTFLINTYAVRKNYKKNLQKIKNRFFPVINGKKRYESENYNAKNLKYTLIIIYYSTIFTWLKYQTFSLPFSNFYKILNKNKTYL